MSEIGQKILMSEAAPVLQYIYEKLTFVSRKKTSSVSFGNYEFRCQNIHGSVSISIPW